MILTSQAIFATIMKMKVIIDGGDYMSDGESSHYDSRIAEKANSTFAKKFKELVPDAKTANALKEYLGISIQAINQYKQGTAYPKTENLIKIADFFGISVDYLLGITSTPNRDTTMQAVCDFTGLSEKAISILNKADRDELDFISFLIENRISCDISSRAFGCAVDTRTIKTLDKMYGTAGLDAKEVHKMIRESDDVRKAFNETQRLKERIDTRLWRCHKLLESAVESFVEYVLREAEDSGKH